MHANMHTNTQTNTQSNTQSNTHADTHADTQTNMQANTHADTHADNYHLIALTKINNIGNVRAKELLKHFDNPKAIFNASKKHLKEISGFGDEIVNSIKKFDDWETVEKELKFTEKYNIDIVTINHAHYPTRLVGFTDAPLVLYNKGKANLNAPKILSIIGTRSISDYGKNLTDQLIEQLEAQNILVVSGMAFGIDAAAHKACVKHGMPNVGVLAHGLDIMYPSLHKTLAKDVLDCGGSLLTEFTSGTKADRHNFPRRNRIVAGICDALIVVETNAKGGSMITANIAVQYKKQLMAYPGRVTDKNSLGCNELIQKNMAHLVNNADDILSILKWNKSKTATKKIQRALFVELDDTEKIIYDLLLQKGSIYIDVIYTNTQLTSSAVANALLMLELKGVLQVMPGKQYKLVD